MGVILVASITPSLFTTNVAYAIETVRTFDGSDYLDVPSTSSLQLPQFVAEVKFRINELPSERGYMVSKGANGDAENLDHNYALYVTKLGKLGGGFKASDGTYHYVYTENPVSLSTWHVAKLVYDGAELKIKVNDNTAGSLVVNKNPDSDDTGPMRIGANANDDDRFFDGDMDYVKILDRSTFKKVYFNDFGGSTPDPTPELRLTSWRNTNT